jgi:hypothetical protein
MSFKVKEHPQKIYESVTFEFKLENENGEVLHLRKWEDGNGGGYYLNTNDSWVEFYPDDDLLDFIDYDLDF